MSADLGDTSDYDHFEEEFAYSMGIQAYIFGEPLTIFERERKIRLDPDFDGMVGIAPVARLNQIGNMDGVATSDDILPYTPNNDTVYSGALLELIDEPIILTAPNIMDRYWSVEVANCYTENIFYIGSRATKGLGGFHAFCGPKWDGDLPKGVVKHQMDYNSIFFCLRIATAKGTAEEEKLDNDKVLALQKKFKLTSLSNWKTNPGVAAVPASITPRPDYKGPLSFFRLLADLMIENPPVFQHAAQWEPFKYIGLVVGQSFNVHDLSRPTRRGLVRAQLMGPKIVDWKVKFRGTPYTTAWNRLQQGTYNYLYLDRAAGATEGLFVHDYVEAIYYSTYQSCIIGNDGLPAGGEWFTSSKRYTMHIDKDRIPLINTKNNGFWSLTMYGPDFQLVANEKNRYSVGDRTLEKNEDGSIDVYFQSVDPLAELGDRASNNWLPCPMESNALFRVNYRMYLPEDGVLNAEPTNRFVPPIVERV